MKIHIADEEIAEDIRAELEELVCLTGKCKQEIIKDSLQDYYKNIRSWRVVECL